MDNIEYSHLVQNTRLDRELLDEIVIRIAGDDYPAELVKAKLIKLNSSHIEFVFDCISKNTTEIRNITCWRRKI